MKNLLFVLMALLLNCKQSQNSGTANNQIPNQKDLLTNLLEKSRVQKKNIFLVFSFKGCAWCRAFEKYHNDSLVNSILGKNFIVQEIDVNTTPGGSDLCKTYGKIGFPSWTILDSTKKVIADSDDGSGNVGYPNKETEFTYYLKALKKADPLLAEKECRILKQKIQEYSAH